MSLIIKRQSDTRVVKSILHRVADIPGGVTVSVATLGGATLFEGTPIGKGSDGLFQVIKTAQIVTDAGVAATSYEVAKGSHFKVGDRFATASANGVTITAIDKSNAAKDVITVDKTLGVAVKAGECAFESSGANKSLKYSPVAVAGNNESIEAGDNVFEPAWVIGVVRESNAPIVNDAIKDALKGIIYV